MSESSSTGATGAELRKHRRGVERDGPNRYAPGYFRHPDPSATVERRRGKPTVEGGGPMSSPEDIAVYAVRLGYKVAEEQVKRSAQAARRLRRASIASGSGDVGDVLAQALRMYRQVSELAVEVAETMGASSRIWTDLYGKYRQQAKRSGKQAADPSGVLLERVLKAMAGVETGGAESGGTEALLRELSKLVTATKPAESGSVQSGRAFVDSPPSLFSSATLEFHKSVDGGVPHCDGLVATIDKRRALLSSEEIEFSKEGDSWHAVVRVDADAHAATYYGLVRVGNEPVGSIEVTLRPRVKKQDSAAT